MAMKGVIDPAEPRRRAGSARCSSRRWRSRRSGRARSPPSPGGRSTGSTRADDVAGLDYRATSATPASSPTPAASTRPATAASSGRCASSPGFGTPEETNQRYKDLLAAGGTGLSRRLRPADADGARPRPPAVARRGGEVRRRHHVAGRHGAAVRRASRSADITTSMTINSPAPMIFAMYLVVAEKQGADWRTICGHDAERHPEGVHRPEGVHLPAAAVDAADHRHLRASAPSDVPKWNTISISGYHIREAGSTALQELAFTLRDGIEYVQYGVDAGLDVDDFAPRLSFFFNSHSDFFEEIAKYRAARKLWAEAMRDRFGAKNPRSWSCASTPRPPACRSPRSSPTTTSCARRCRRWPAVLGGTKSLHTNSLDEALALPTEEAATHRAAHAADHRARERRHQRRRSARRLVLRREADARHGAGALEVLPTRSTRMGGMVEAVERGFPQREIAEAAYQFQQAVEREEKVIVGVNDYVRWTRSRSRSSTSTRRRPRRRWRAWPSCKRDARQRPRCERALDGAAQAARGHATTSCRRSSSASAPTPRSARCATRCARSGASTRKCRHLMTGDAVIWRSTVISDRWLR